MSKQNPGKKAKFRRVRKAASRSAAPSTHTAAASKLDRLASLLARREGASIEEMMLITGWQPHSVRGALAGSLKKRGLIITSEKVDGIRRYKGGPAT